MRDHPSLEYAAPFLVFVALLGGERLVPLGPHLLYVLRVLLVSLVTLALSRRVISLRISWFWQSAAVGVLVWAVWIGPDLLWPTYRHSWLFENSLTGTARSSLPATLRAERFFLLVRLAGSSLLVPVIEELFWRSWLLRWLIDRQFWKIPLGTYTAASFWTVAVLFAGEHGPYWDVGLLAGIIYNWWMIRTRSLGDCILSHAVTNACLGAYVILSGQWQYWL
jgi:CAAX prenyl protease-like protein